MRLKEVSIVYKVLWMCCFNAQCIVSMQDAWTLALTWVLLCCNGRCSRGQAPSVTVHSKPSFPCSKAISEVKLDFSVKGKYNISLTCEMVRIFVEQYFKQFDYLAAHFFLLWKKILKQQLAIIACCDRYRRWGM